MTLKLDRFAHKLILLAATLSLAASCSPGEVPSSPVQVPAPSSAAGTRLTVFASDPEYGVYGMYREGNEYVFYHVKAEPQGDSVAAAARFFDRDMSVLVEAGDVSTASLVASNRTAAPTGSQSALVARAAAALDESLGDEVFVSERSALSTLIASPSGQAGGRQELMAKSSKVKPATRAGASALFFKGLHRNLSWKKDGTRTLTGRYLGTTFHASTNPFKDADAPGGVREEHNARLTSATGVNIAVQLGGDEVPQGYTVGPSDDAPPFSAVGRSAVESLENHHQSLGEAFVAGRTINAKSDFPQEEREIFARMSAHLSSRLLPLPSDEPAASGETGELTQALSSANVYKSWLRLSNQTVAVVGQHSATLTNFFLNGSYRGGTWYCNHGCCDQQRTNGCNMAYGCDTGFIVSSTGFNIPPYTKDGGNYQGLATYHTCTTAFSASPIDVHCNSHVCNDDSRTQVRAVRKLGFCVNGSTCYNRTPYSYNCSDCVVNARAPGCGG